MVRYPDAYVRFLVHFHADRDYFECHEVLEEYWKADRESIYREAWVVLIQIAVALYHERRGNRRGALKMWASAARKLREGEMEQLGLDGAQLRALLEMRARRLSSLASGNFIDMDLPITDEELLRRCVAECAVRGQRYGSPSRMDDESLIHKHTLRDRSEVIAEREREKAKRAASKPR